MKIIQFSDYQETNDLSVLDGARWLLIHHSQLDAAASRFALSISNSLRASSF